MKTVKQMVAAAALVGIGVMPLAAQQPASARPAQTPGQMGGATPAMGAMSAIDTAFVQEAAIGGMAEVELGKLASGKGVSAEVKQFARRMVADHSKANGELKALASKKHATLPTALDAPHKAIGEKLAKLSGAAFDREYLREMVAAHDKDVALFKGESTTGSDPDLKAWATKTLPRLEAHQKMVKELSAKMAPGATTK